jgi:phosphatidylserine/phosphatidylglycerophosphate/cardiolipin synthase-like enzyme
MPDPRPGNEVEFFLSGLETYNAMAKALETAHGANHFIYLSNWIVFDDFNLVRDPANRLQSTDGTTLENYLQRASKAGVMIRALFWDRKLGGGDYEQNRRPRDFISNLKTGHAIHDGRVQSVGSHHQKLLLINGRDGLIAFAGGVDFHPNRVFWGGDKRSDLNAALTLDSPTAPLLDVHVRIRGPAAYDLLEIFLRRYADHPSAAGHEIIALRPDPSPPPGFGHPHNRVTARVCATFGKYPATDGDEAFTPSKEVQDRLLPKTEGADSVTIAGNSSPSALTIHPYSFAPKGRQSGRAQLLHAISSARKFIYFEDQYMVSSEIAEALKKAVNRGVAVLGVIPHQSISDDFDPGPVNSIVATLSATASSIAASRDGGVTNVLGSARRSRVIEVIHGKMADPGKLNFLFSPYRGVDHLKVGPHVGPYQYVHSKVFVFDDVFCTIGSMNFNLRSTTHDSELCLGFYEPGPAKESFAQRLRMGLWARHLGLGEDDVHLLADPVKAIADLWSQLKTPIPNRIQLPDGRRVIANVMRYDWSQDETLEKRASESVPEMVLAPAPRPGVPPSTWSGVLGDLLDALYDPVVTGDETDLP